MKIFQDLQGLFSPSESLSAKAESNQAREKGKSGDFLELLKDSFDKPESSFRVLGSNPVQNETEAYKPVLNKTEINESSENQQALYYSYLKAEKPAEESNSHNTDSDRDEDLSAAEIVLDKEENSDKKEIETSTESKAAVKLENNPGFERSVEARKAVNSDSIKVNSNTRESVKIEFKNQKDEKSSEIDKLIQKKLEGKSEKGVSSKIEKKENQDLPVTAEKGVDREKIELLLVQNAKPSKVESSISSNRPELNIKPKTEDKKEKIRSSELNSSSLHKELGIQISGKDLEKSKEVFGFETGKIENKFKASVKKKNETDKTESFSSELKLQNTVKDIHRMDKELAGLKDLREFSGLDRDKWQVIKNSREYTSLERKKDVQMISSDILAKQLTVSSNDSDKGQSLKNSFSFLSSGSQETGKASEKSVLSEKLVPGREEFKNSLNELVQKARVQILENGKSTAQISLYPKDLGKMTLNIEVLKDKVDGRILVENETIKTLVQADMSGLKQELKQNGFDLQNVYVEVRNDQFAGFSSGDSNLQNKESLNSNGIVGRYGSNDNSSEEESIESAAIQSDRLLDIKV